MAIRNSSHSKRRKRERECNKGRRERIRKRERNRHEALVEEALYTLAGSSFTVSILPEFVALTSQTLNIAILVTAAKNVIIRAVEDIRISQKEIRSFKFAFYIRVLPAFFEKRSDCYQGGEPTPLRGCQETPLFFFFLTDWDPVPGDYHGHLRNLQACRAWQCWIWEEKVIDEDCVYVCMGIRERENESILRCGLFTGDTFAILRIEFFLNVDVKIYLCG